MMVSFLLANRFPLLRWWAPSFASSIMTPTARRMLAGDLAHHWSANRDPYNGGPPTWMEDISLEPNRHGFVEETHYTIAHSPVPDEFAPRGIGLRAGDRARDH